MPDVDPALVDRAAALASRGDRVVLGIVGEPGAGKTTVALGLIDALRARGVPVAWLPMDGFHLGDRSLDELGLRARKGAIETFDGWGYLATLRRVIAEASHPVYVPGFERTLEQPIAADRVIPSGPALIVTEGNYLLDDAEPWSLVREVAVEVWYADVPDDVRRARLVDRHVEFGKSRADAEAWVATVDEPNAARIRARRHTADVIVDVPS
ncbi:nucleoside/nucleotide kinase family protein [Microbacterium candidum]|uniref:Nucleoside/nucleotide kinase family protein n=1 Tax=Microbacterium candidum TaxID=3041922 RepID=A0ABT7MTY6_9MICO|nr:nucleoside/nucleotide kinase family protein [Microbacterium sp. ASV49]MDL9977909.1 nucleoside/nucleotide kinase family protein [Microbacterium sp. ASV49]